MTEIIRKYKMVIFILFLAYWLPAQSFSDSGGVFYEFPLLFAHSTNSPLNCHYGGIFDFSVTPGYQHLGWFAGLMFSTIPPAENVYGSIFGGILLAQELKAGIVSITFRALPGIGISVSDLGAYPGHLDLTGEVQVGLGIYPVEWMQFSLFCGIRGTASLFPLIPFQDYALYATTMGCSITWQS